MISLNVDERIILSSYPDGSAEKTIKMLQATEQAEIAEKSRHAMTVHRLIDKLSGITDEELKNINLNTII